MPFKDKLYKHDIATLKEYGSNGYKLTLHKALRTSGLEYKIVRSPKGSVNTSKLDNNISRAKAKVFEYASCNDWQFFATLTIDKSKFDRYSLNEFYKKFSIFIQNLNRDNSCKIKYVLLPEQHKDGAWHLHGLFSDIPRHLLCTFSLKERLPNYILQKLRNNQIIYYLKNYSEKFGFCCFEPIIDKKRVASYITKYITKDLQKTVQELGGHLYYCSKGLNTAKLIIKDYLSIPLESPDYVNDYVKIKHFETLKNALSYFGKEVIE